MSRPDSVRPGRRVLVWAAAVLILVLVARTAAAASTVSRRLLTNGLTMVYEHNPASPLTVLSLVIKGGQRDEPEGLAGLSHFTARLLLEIQDAQSAQALMQQASSTGMAALADVSLFSVEALSEHFEDTLRIVSQSLFNPLFSAIRLDHVKESMNYQRLVLEDDAVQLGHQAQLRAAFGDTAYGPPSFGTEQSLKTIGKKQASEFYRSHFRSGGVVLAVVSDLPEDAVAAVIQKTWPAFPSGPAPDPLPLKPFPLVQGRTYLSKQTNQTLISYGFRLPELTARNFALASLAENILGKGPGSRLWPLRQKEKLAYNVAAEATLFKEAGLLEIYLETDPARAGLAAARLKQVLSELTEHGIDAEELQTAKAMAKANALRDNETKDRRCSNRAFWEAAGLGADFLERLAAEVDSVSGEEFQAFVRTCLNPDQASLVVVGPADIRLAPDVREETRR